MASNFDVLSSGGTGSQAMGTFLGVDLETASAEVPFGKPQQSPKPPADPHRANMFIAAALRDGDPNDDSGNKADGAPYRD